MVTLVTAVNERAQRSQSCFINFELKIHSQIPRTPEEMNLAYTLLKGLFTLGGGLFRAAPAAYGGSRARGLIRAVAATYTQLMATPDP